MVASPVNLYVYDMRRQPKLVPLEAAVEQRRRGRTSALSVVSWRATEGRLLEYKFSHVYGTVAALSYCTE